MNTTLIKNTRKAIKAFKSFQKSYEMYILPHLIEEYVSNAIIYLLIKDDKKVNKSSPCYGEFISDFKSKVRDVLFYSSIDVESTDTVLKTVKSMIAQDDKFCQRVADKVNYIGRSFFPMVFNSMLVDKLLPYRTEIYYLLKDNISRYREHRLNLEIKI